MAKWKPLSIVIPQYLIGLYWLPYVFLYAFRMLLQHGPMKFFLKKKHDKRPEVFDNPSLWTHKYAQLSSVKLHYVIGGPEDKPLMLFLHGFPEFWYSWRHQLKEFCEDYRCVAVDQRGYNESDKPEGAYNYTMNLLTGDIKELISELGYEKCFLVAHDWGGGVAWDFTWRNPNLVEKLIVMNTGNSKSYGKHMKAATSQFKKSWYMFFFQLPLIPELFFSLCDYQFLEDAYTGPHWGTKKQGVFPEEEIECYKYVHSGGVTAAINWYRASFRYTATPYENEKVTVPTLIIWGTGDMAIEQEIATYSADCCDTCEIKYIEGCSHWVQQEEPEKVIAYMREFLAKR